MRDARPETDVVAGPPETVPNYDANFLSQPDRWSVPMPEWRRYPTQPDAPYVRKHWYDPYNRNPFKGDYPIAGKGFWQRWFFNFTGESMTGVDVRRVPLPSGVSAENPGDRNFFGNGEQAAISQNFALSLIFFGEIRASGHRLSHSLHAGVQSQLPADPRTRPGQTLMSARGSTDSILNPPACKKPMSKPTSRPQPKLRLRLRPRRDSALQ